jgi:rod shape-determining protein MreD
VWQYRPVTWVLLSLAALVLQTSLLSRIYPASDTPSLLLTMVVAFALFETPARGAALGGIAGLLADLAAGRLIGLNTALWGLAGAAVGWLSGRIVRDDIFVPGLLGALVQTAYTVVAWGVVALTPYREPLHALSGAVPASILFGLFMTPALIALLRLRPRHEVDDRLKF